MNVAKTRKEDIIYSIVTKYLIVLSDPVISTIFSFGSNCEWCLFTIFLILCILHHINSSI